ncbi:hypothetical protein PY093_20605 [Cytobacillus sp. S13-E01]|uniref:hypothetical protein n=1 Tax=Cytobacillus sp. S13-E01 TaxID=3031326 RepID=UPI0023D82769|nr:hypothetical protein [Cytobacillus sp. S13-E01]MDF0729012.1 hypothetical protein [Cytobacillus sp. S13-E01]
MRMDKQIDKKKILTKALLLMNPKIKKSLLNAERSEREDLEQEIRLKVSEAVLNGKIEFPLTYSDYQEEFNKKNNLRANFC